MSEFTVNAHSSINIVGSRSIRFDPFMIENAPHDADIIFITHPHYDHFSPEDIEKVAKADTVFVCPADMELDTPYKLRPGEKTAVCGIEVEAVAAYNLKKKYHPKENGWLGYRVVMDGRSYYVCGDTDIVPEAEKVKCDVLFVPCGGTYTMDYREAAQLANIIKPEKAVPTHYGAITGDPDDGYRFEQLLM